MAKRFSMREMALLTAPILVIGAIGLYFSRRPQADDGKLKLSFHIAQPTALQAFEGYDSRWSIAPAGANAQLYYVQDGSPWIELRTPQRVETSRQGDKNASPWGKIWGSGVNNDTFLMRSRFLPPGEAHFNFKGLAVANKMPAPPSLKPQRVSGAWKIDRAQLKPLKLASWPRKPLVSVREVKIAQVVFSPASGLTSVIGETTFQFEGAGMTDETRLETHYESASHGISWGSRSQYSTPPKGSRQHTTEWTIYPATKSKNLLVHVTGRASADNRWPLGFQIEPFDFKTAKVGQHLKFKQSPVALPKN